ncbi:MAG: hypothetical protein HKN79_03795 [Flavobacteriales bacterium]|nr:hypothetical protein [Flavobacteriales bacterium]
MKRASIFLIVLGLISCSDLTEERWQIDRLQEKVTQEQARLKRLHPDSLPMTSADVTSRIRTVTDHYDARVEIMVRDLSLLMADFKVFSKVFKGLPQKRMKIQEELEISAQQLTDLETDLVNQAIDKEQAQKFIADEQSAMVKISNTLDQLDTLMTRGRRGYLRMVPQVDSVIQALGPLPSEQ